MGTGFGAFRGLDVHILPQFVTQRHNLGLHSDAQKAVVRRRDHTRCGFRLHHACPSVTAVPEAVTISMLLMTS